MSYILVLFLALTQSAATPSLDSVIEGVSRTYGRMADFSADFVQVEQNSLNRRDQGTGHLYLMRPRMARYEYTQPEPQVFVSDGKTVYMYIPADRQVTKDKVSEALDNRIPLLFLVGRANLRGEFESFERLSIKPVVEGSVVIKMKPKRKSDLMELIMEVDPQKYLIRRLVLVQGDGSRSDLTFSNIQTNTGLKKTFFDFKIPPGVRVVQGMGQ
jgi:outer membrane lipoprotein carrier protein